ncbi:MAG: hypothetical protein GY795_08425 [Desulfobacterales bacterium]|nr:hypothetical protein [Desulfobacterales bacterium]
MTKIYRIYKSLGCGSFVTAKLQGRQIRKGKRTGAGISHFPFLSAFLVVIMSQKSRTQIIVPAAQEKKKI